MATIAIIGTPGAGKTVFLSVLAMHYRKQEPGKPWLDYKNRETQRYVTEAWDALQNQEWPPSTPPGKFPSLEWDLHTSDGEKHTLMVRDPAGQDVRAIYDAPVEDRTEDQKALKLVFDSADMLLFLINLRPAMDAAGNQSKIDDIEIPLKLAIQGAMDNRRRVLILVSQHDIIADRLELLKEQVSSGAQQAISHFLPQIGGLLQSHKTAIGTLFVASVAETVPVVEDGKTYRRPKSEFCSQGLKEVLKWIEEQMPQIARDIQARADAIVRDGIEKAEKAEKERRRVIAAKLRPQLYKSMSCSLAALVVTGFLSYLAKAKAFDHIHKRIYDAAVVEQVVPVERENYTASLPFNEFEIRESIDLSRAHSSFGDYYRDITFVNKSGKNLYSVEILFTWETSFWGTAKSSRMKIANIQNGYEWTVRSLIYCDSNEWKAMRYQVLAYYKLTSQEKQWVHDHSKDDQINATAEQESKIWGLAGAGVGSLFLLYFVIKTIVTGRQMNGAA